jgi:hypothetical protein
MSNCAMAKLNRAVLPMLVILFGLGVFVGAKFPRWFSFGSKSRDLSSTAILQQVKTLSELVTVQYVIEKVEGFEEPSEHLVGQLIGSENRVLLLAHGTVKAGIDLGKLTPDDIHISGKTITIKLPHAKITDAYLDDSLTKVIDRKTGILAPPDKDLEQTARQNAVDNIRRAARVGGILNDAESRAKTQLEVLFKQLGFEKVQFENGATPVSAREPKPM